MADNNLQFSSVEEAVYHFYKEIFGNDEHGVAYYTKNGKCCECSDCTSKWSIVDAYKTKVACFRVFTLV